MFAYVGGLSISQSFLITPIITKSCARWCVRQVMPAGVLLLSISFVGASFATEMWQLMLAQGVCFGWGMGILFVGTIGLLPQWFQKRSGLANALAASGSGFGGLGYSFITEALISGLRHPNALRILGCVTLAVNSIAVLLLRQRSTQQQSSKSYALLLLYSVLHGLVAGAFWAVIAPILIDIVGLQVFTDGSFNVSEAIALEIVDSRGGSYLGVTMCTGAMYLGAAMCSLAVYLIRKQRGIDSLLMA
ncbi:hypothetical protein CEP52_006388 [Fusarium oligoseptatum]|uniref:Major facilitator superfamily transporter n=1 Tax=Fusarium oligoseptatum TaxID=2604345 RepID=A0A428TT74_9HYPO|nr:hypothetical protein CEP52_006388 [Fusarium oligoseptatum]